MGIYLYENSKQCCVCLCAPKTDFDCSDFRLLIYVDTNLRSKVGEQLLEVICHEKISFNRLGFFAFILHRC